MNKPLMIFDGDCGFCRRWIEIWKKTTGDTVRYASSQEVGGQFPQISPETFKETVVLVDAQGKIFTGAEAVFRGLAEVPTKGWLLKLYQKFPGFAPVAEWGYRRVAHHRMLSSKVSRFFLGKNFKPSTYYIPRRIFFILLGIIYLIAFSSLGFQVEGLIGSQGILPADQFLEQIFLHLGGDAYWKLPTVFWLGVSNEILLFVCWAGAILSIVLILGFSPVLVSALLWFFYLSLFSVGQTFLGFQWDILLIETGFLSIFLAPLNLNPKKAIETKPSWAVLWLMRWLLFRLMFQSGLVKLMSGDTAWKNLTALGYHYETQPLPTWISYYAHHLPTWIQRESVWILFVMELAVPFLIFIPGRTRILGGILLLFLQVMIILTGNYGFFNILTIALCLLLIPDRDWPRRIRKWFYPIIGSRDREGIRRWPKVIIIPLTFLVFTLSLDRFERRFTDFDFFSKYFGWLSRETQSFHLANNYGLFAVMTKNRPEITVEGSNDGENWKPYRFPYKPGELDQRPKFVAPHMPRLDWQMWFAALRSPMQYPRWFENFLIRLLEGSPAVLSLLKTNPFPEGPPRMVRARVANYYFTDPAVKKATGEWWWKGPEQKYSATYEKVDGQIRRR